MKKTIAILLALLMVATAVFAQSISESKPDKLGRFSLGMKTNGFTVTNISDFEMIGADLIKLRHDKTGAIVLFILNEDTNRTFDIAFRTPTEQDTGIPHVFEHATLGGSEKYPSKTLWFNVKYQTYNTYMNASTSQNFTQYPVASLSEDQLLSLADFYTDSVLHPMVMWDKSIFDEEAWRYVLKDPDDELTIAGTVYSEMQGAMTLIMQAAKNFESTIFPGSYMANNSGGNPDVIPDMTWQDLKDYHDKYYHPSNSLTTIYGKIDRWEDFLGMLDSYFSAYDRKVFNITDPNYKPITGPVEKTFDYPVEAGSDTTRSSTVFYGFVCKDADNETMDQIDIMSMLLVDDSSVLAENVKNALPYGSFGSYIDFNGPELMLEFYIQNVDAEDAELFKSVVDSSLAQIAKDGFDPVAIDSLAANIKLSLMMSGESSSVGQDMVGNFSYYWAGVDNPYGYCNYIDCIMDLKTLNDEGVFKDLISKYAVNNKFSALVTTKPVAGLKEQKDAAMADRLAKVKASMSDAEIDAIVKTTNEQEEETVDTAAMVRQIQVVDVQSLPEEIRLYDINDEVGSDGIRHIWAKANVSDVGYAGILFDASGLRQDQILFFKLWTDLMGELDTERHTRTEISSLIVRYLFSGSIGADFFDDEITKEMMPKLKVNFVAMDEDVEAALDLVHELLFENVFDVSRLTDLVTRFKGSLKQAITSNSYSVLVYRARAREDEAIKYYNYINYLDYYNFLDSVLATLETNPQAIVSALQDVVSYFNNSTNAITLFAGSEDSNNNYLAKADAFLSGLDKRPIEKQVYDLPVASGSEAIIVDSSVNYNIIYASNETLGYKEKTGDFDAVTQLINDMYLMPELRDKRGAYGAYISVRDDGVFAYTYRDPNIADSYAVYDGLADFVANIDIDQKTLDGYILSAYSKLALNPGEINGAVNALLKVVAHKDPAKVLDNMRELKAVKAETFAQTYAPLFQTLVDNYDRHTSGSASAISAVEDAFEVVLNPFGVVDKSQVTLSDVTGEGPFDEAIQFCFVNGLMEAKSDSEFGVDLPATLGEFAQILVTLLGAPGYSAEDSIALLSQYGVVPMAETGTVLSTGELDVISCRLLATFAGISRDELLLSDLEAMDIDPASQATRDIVALYAYYVYYVAVAAE